ncbi:MAG: hypothetical protein H0T74_16850 [Rubrobacteraceae bacterium]|nr:hypothetical protein [Rubrobacteraceae bacterium]
MGGLFSSVVVGGVEIPNRIVMPPITTRLADRAGFDLVELHPLRGHHLRGGPLLQGLVKSLPIYVVFFVVISLLIFFPALSLWIPGLMGVY